MPPSQQAVGKAFRARLHRRVSFPRLPSSPPVGFEALRSEFDAGGAKSQFLATFFLKMSAMSGKEAISRKALLALAEKIRLEFQSGERTVTDWAYIHPDIDQLRRLWKEQKSSPADYDFFERIDELGRNRGWKPERIKSLKGTGKPNQRELEQWAEHSRNDEYIVYAVSADIKVGRRIVGVALFSQVGGTDFFLLGAFRSKAELKAFARKNRMMR